MDTGHTIDDLVGLGDQTQLPMFLLRLWTMRTSEKWQKQNLNKASIINYVYCVDKSHVYIYIHNSYTGNVVEMSEGKR